MITLDYEVGGAFMVKLLQYKASEVRVLCPKCGSVLLYAPDHESAARLKVHPGLHCPKDWKHVSVTFSLKS